MAASLAGRIDRAIRLSLILLMAAAVLAVVLVVTKTRPEPVLLSPSALNSQTINLPRIEGMSGGALVGNPLFWASRRPYNESTEEIEEIARPSGPTAIDDMELVGIITSGVEASAVIVTIRGQRQRIPFGGEVAGWELVSMTPTEATFMGTDGNGELIEHRFSLEHRRGQPSGRARGSVQNNQDPNGLTVD